jgi:murein DD-endopeptidase MepM/ murein hydrolase activator NlpD
MMSAKINSTALMTAAQAKPAGQETNTLAGKLKHAVSKGDVSGVREAAQKFEGFFVQMMLKEMRKAQASEEGLFSGTEMETFSELFDEEIAGRISSGRGIGLANHIVKSMLGESGAAMDAQALGTSHAVHRVYTPAPVSGAGGGRFSWPLPQSEPGRISSDFGMRKNTHGDGHKHHHGLDIAAPSGTPVLSMASGTITRASYSPTYGNVVYVDHGDGVVSRYAHQERLDVAKGDNVVRGQQIGVVGSTGRSTGAHLHLEVRVGGKAMDPHEFLGQAGH